jgi:hypothetical protein
MKRLVIALLMFATLGMIYPGLPAIAQPLKLPHENPETATGLLDESVLLLSYSSIIDLATGSQYRNAQDVLKELEHADIPDDIRYVSSQYDEICRKLFSALDTLQSLLDEISDLLARNRVDEARQRLASTDNIVRDAGYLLKDTETAANSLSEKLGVFSTTVTSRVTQAFDRLKDSLKRLKYLVDKLNYLKRSLTEQYIQLAKLLPSTLTMSISPPSAFVGENITAYGRLSSRDRPLGDKGLYFAVDNVTMATTTTRPDGTYTAIIALPYRYSDNITFTAVYEPSGDDTKVYLAGRSQPVTIRNMYYPTWFEVTTPEKIFPGVSFTISGEVVTASENIVRNINVRLDNTSLARATVAGRFSLEITPPRNTLLGKRYLVVAVTPEERHSGASENRSIIVSSMRSVRIQSRTPAIVLLPGTITVSGTVYDEYGPAPDTPVDLRFKNTSFNTRTARDGSFNSVIKLSMLPVDIRLSTNLSYVSPPSNRSPSDLLPLGIHRIEISVASKEAQATGTSVIRQIGTINPLSTSLILGIFTASWWITRRRIKARTHPEENTLPPQVLKLPAKTPSPAMMTSTLPIPHFTGIRRRVLSAYRNGLAVIEKITGIMMGPDTTLREFLKKVSLPSATATERFAELTAIAESSLYSAFDPHQEIVARAEELADTIREELRYGTS